MMRFSDDAWQRNQSIYRSILTLPFNVELAGGTLSEGRFRHYMIQDAHYLEAFARALSLISAKGLSADHVVHFAAAAQTAIVVERSLHADYFARFSISPDEFAATRPSPVCDHYVSYLLRIAALQPFEIAVAAVLPCFWIYREVGKHIHAQAAVSNPYRAWIETYSSPEFDAAVDAAVSVADAAAVDASQNAIAAMHAAFSRAAQLEWMFWDSAYKLAGWPV
ncbi:MAG: thiaminase II [Hyphomicrobiaceae bacterium]